MTFLLLTCSIQEKHSMVQRQQKSKEQHGAFPRGGQGRATTEQAAGRQGWPPAPAAASLGDVLRQKAIFFLNPSARGAPQQLELWGLWLRWEGCSRGTTGRGKAASVAHGGKDHWHVNGNGTCNSRGKKNVKMLYKCVCVMGKNNRNLDRRSKWVFGHM